MFRLVAQPVEKLMSQNQAQTRHLTVWRGETELQWPPEMTTSSGWIISEVDGLEALSLVASQRSLDALLFPADPSDRESTCVLEGILQDLGGERPLVITYSKSNARWVGAFVKWLGSDFHFYGVPESEDVLARADEILDALSGGARRSA